MSFEPSQGVPSLARSWLPILACVLGTLPMVPPLVAQSQEGGIQRFDISQARQTGADPVTVRAYLDAQEAGGGPVEKLTEAELTVTIGSAPAQVTARRPFAAVDEGVGTVFLVDISRSLRRDDFQEMRQAIESWIAGLDQQDRVALIAFGSQSRVLVDWTADFDEFRSSLQSLAPTDDLTLLNQALADALDLGDRKDDDLPGRRAVVVLSDGRDEGSSLALEDILARIRSNPTPIYPIGFVPTDRRDRGRDLEVLRRLGSNSGGRFFEANRTSLTDAYRRIREAITGVWTVDLSCPRCSADGDEYRLQVDLETAGRVLSDGIDLRLLPGPTPEATARPEGPEDRATERERVEEAAPGAVTTEQVEETSQTSAEQSSQQPATRSGPARPSGGGSWFLSPKNLLFFWLPLLLGLGLLVAGVIRARQSGKTSADASAGSRPSRESVEAPGWSLEAKQLYESESDHPDAESRREGGRRETGSSSFSLSLPKPDELEQKGQGAYDSGSVPRGAVEERDPTSQFPSASLGLDLSARQAPQTPPQARPPRTATEEDLPVGRSYAVTPRVVRLIVLRGSSKGKQFRALLRDRMVVGGRSTSDLVLAEEPNVAPEQFALSQEAGDIFIENLAEEKPTLVNGLELESKQVLQAGDLVGNGDVILRVALGD